MHLFDSAQDKVGAAKSPFAGGKAAPAPTAEAKPSPGSPPAAAPGPDKGAKAEVDPKLAAKTADQLTAAMKGWGTDENAIHNALRGKSAAEISAIKAAYAKANPGTSLDAALRDELSGGDLKEAQAYLTADPVKSATAALKNASAGWGTDETKIALTLKALAPEDQAKVRAQFKKETGQSVEHMLDGELSGKDLNEAKNELAAKFSTGLGPEIDELAKKSPTLQHRLSGLQDAGWTVSYGTAGKGTYADKGKKMIVIDPNKQGDPMALMRSLSHEAGHAAYTADPYQAPSGKTKDEYVQANTMNNLKDEGEATISNLEIRAELLAAKAGDIGVSGGKGEEYKKLYEKYPDPKDRDTLRAEIGKIFAKGEVPSVKKPDGTLYANYEDYYSQTYSDYWDKNVKPGEDGKAPLPDAAPRPAEADHSSHGH